MISSEDCGALALVSLLGLGAGLGKIGARGSVMLRRLIGGPDSGLLHARALTTVHSCAHFRYSGEGKDRHCEAFFGCWPRNRCSEAESPPEVWRHAFPREALPPIFCGLTLSVRAVTTLPLGSLRIVLFGGCRSVKAAGPIDAISALSTGKREHPLNAVMLFDQPKGNGWARLSLLGAGFR